MRTLIKDVINKEGEQVELMGWVAKRRDHGKIIFIDLRDRSGVAQIVFSGGATAKEGRSSHQLFSGSDLKPGYMVKISGLVKKRPAEMINDKIPTGHYEIQAKDLEILSPAETPPFALDTDGYEVNEEIRLRYRYLDLRRPRLQNNLKARHRVIKFIRDYLSDRDFVEVETPLLTKSTPEGARDYIVPSRLQPGKFYALPQSPQQYKQLLMVAGLERYFQIAKAIRDEDTRGDRQPEHTQLDLEMSFVDQEDVLALMENLFTELVQKLFPDKEISQIPWPRLTYKEAMEKYGTDKPDLRKDKNNKNELAFGWIVDFPIFQYDEKEKRIAPMHHIFTAPAEEDIELLDKEPLKVRGKLYDIFCNGEELASGSVRINKSELQQKMFEIIGIKKDEARKKFGHLLEAYKYGGPPHAGIAFGIDRFVAIVQNEPNIRETIAFPKTGDGRDLMMDAPSEVDEEQLKELHIKIDKEEKK